MSALARTTEINCDTRAANEDCINGGSRTRTKFCYDANGNMTSATYGTHGSQTTAWTSYNQPSYLSGSGSSSQFFYDADHQRYKQLASYSGAVENTIYVGGLLEKMSNSTGTAYRHYIPAGNNTVVYTRLSSGTNATYYMTKDHLGSTAIVTDQTGASLVQEKFAALGWSETSPAGQATMATISRHEFTGHEGMENLGMVNMNGRIYIPSGSMFISPDPYIPEPGNTQSFNRYSYANNNPLTLIDPTGFDDASPIPEVLVNGFVAGAEYLGNGIEDFVGWISSLFGGGGGGDHLTAQQQKYSQAGLLNAQNLQGAPGAVPSSDGWRMDLADAVSGTQGPQVTSLTEVIVTSQFTGGVTLTTPAPTLEEVAAQTDLDLGEIAAGQAQSANYPSEIASTPTYWQVVGQSMARSGPKAAIVLTVAGFIPPIALEARVIRAGLAARGLTAADFGAQASIRALEGTLSVQGRVATVSVGNIRGNLGHYMDALNALKGTARATGATTLRIEGTVANPTLMRALERSLGPPTRGLPGGPQDVWTIPLGP